MDALQQQVASQLQQQAPQAFTQQTVILPNALASKEIDGVVYQLLPLAPDKVIQHGTALLSTLLATPMAKAIAAGEDDAAMAAAIAGALSNLSSPVLKAAIDELWGVSLAGGQGLGHSWKIHFLGKSGTLVRFLVWALEAQFSDFFGSLTGVLKDAATNLKAKAEAKKAAQS